MPNSFSFDPKLFISPPFKKCPDCLLDTYGIYSINSASYKRKCSECGHSESLNLFPVKKKIIYLDQFVVSNMMKALKKDHEKNGRFEKDSIWVKIFSKLDRLIKLQLIICPKSENHSRELQLTRDAPFIKRMVDQMARGIEFKDFSIIEQLQIYECATHWQQKDTSFDSKIEMTKVFRSDPNKWTENLLITLEYKDFDELIEAERRFRENVSEELKDIFKNWQQQKKSFSELKENEIRNFGKSVINAHQKHVAAVAKYIQCQGEGVDPLSTLPGSSEMILNCIGRALVANGAELKDIERLTCEFLADDYLKNCPFLDITSSLWAAVARKAASGKMKPPGKGMEADIRTISCLLPYCDALFLDAECWGYFQEQPLKDNFSKYGRIFSLRTEDQFLAYLDEIEQAADPDHLALVKEVYGDKADRPFFDLFEFD